jgi:mannose-6-phosphate isomerase-like protein (cupin superfamily)
MLRSEDQRPMNRVNQDELPWDDNTSPKGAFSRFGRRLVHALEAPETGPPLPARVPFDVTLVRVPAGAANVPFHAHAAEWECYLILAGTGTVRHGDGRAPLRAGDCVLCPPGDPHQIINDGDADLLYYVVSDNAPAEVWHYPDSDKWGVRGSGIFRRTPAKYFDGEE